MEALIPEIWIRRIISGFLFGGTGGLISVSYLGRLSGAHLNPVVTMSFRLFGKMDIKTTGLYIIAQLTGAMIGSVPLLLWREQGRSINFGATTPGIGYTAEQALLGEILTTFGFITLLIMFLSFRGIRPYTPFLSACYFAITVPLVADISGISTNPARSFGPSVISGVWLDGWIYWVGPIVGALLACILWSRLARRITVAKLYHFDSDNDRLFRRMSRNTAAKPANQPTSSDVT